jgi:3',5'-cyclic-nucleotide phosphodiesterase
MTSPKQAKPSTEVRVELEVLSGPDTGKTLSFVQPEVTIGRASDNDYVLNDGFVSSYHGVIRTNGIGEVEYRDLESSHGSLVALEDGTRRLHKDGEQVDTLVDGCELQVGCTLIEVQVREAIREGGGETTGEFGGQSENESDKVITQALEPVQSISRGFETDDERLEILFRLAGELNGRTELQEILDLVVDATFDAFPNANFFAITLVTSPEEVGTESPFYTRVRGDLPDYSKQDEEPVLSTSILEHVVERQESILFLKDSIGAEVSDSIVEADITSCLCAPLVGQRSLLGVMEVDTRGEGGVFSRRDLDLFSVLASNVAFAIERAELSHNILEMFESFVAASVDAIEARDPTTAGHSERVTDYTMEFVQTVNNIDEGPVADLHLDHSERKELRYAALLHDFGKIGVDEAVLQKGKRLPESHLEIIEQRFEALKAGAFEKRIRDIFENQETLSRETFEAVDDEYEAFCERLDGYLAKINEIADAASLTDEQVEWVEGIGEESFVDAEGDEHRFLTPFEVDSLSIRFGTLNDEEWEKVKSHPSHSERFLERIPWSEQLDRIPTIAGAHHEKLDGSGYPNGMEAEELIPQMRMLTIADIFDALTASDRPYRDAYSIDRAVAILEAEAEEGKLDADLVEVFAEDVLPKIADRVPDPD